MAMLAMTVEVVINALTRCDLNDGGRWVGPLPWSELIIGRMVLYGRGSRTLHTREERVVFTCTDHHNTPICIGWVECTPEPGEWCGCAVGVSS